MAPGFRYIRMDMDELAYKHSDNQSDEWEKSLHKAAIYREVASFIGKHRLGKPVELHKLIRGGYNIFYRLEYEDGASAALRIPCPGVKFPDKKVRYEVATMRYVAANTTIPVPEIYYWGTAEENPLGWGPLIIMEYVEHERTLSHKLQFLYRQMANILLQLSTLSFSRIGSSVQNKEGQFSVSGRRLMQNMNSLFELTDAPASLLPTHGFATSNEWYNAMADMHLLQLTFQHNNAVDNEDDAYDKYVARQLFRKLASDGRLASGFDPQTRENREPIFRLFSEDLGPSNVLIDKDLRVVGVIDWEFAYAAPAEFSYDPPWWLLLKYPEYWPGGYEDWMGVYEPHFRTFISVLEEEENKLRVGDKIRDDPQGLSVSDNETWSLSRRMQRNWESKSWMIRYAARNSWALDFLFWRYLDSRYFGENQDADRHARLHLLSQHKIDAMEPFVKLKMEQDKEKVLVRWSDEDVKAELSKVML
ncbi:kinase-like domain-containing protein [Ilyonectria robusta]|uniref:kinase-like domain-containing protein n=1 Tax=Ilyonectria robusta TaxID=1079257 RepID=UPI001E8D1483|nr:kinase-like domain-containing protein [Ilyonectria robusta]KAH8659539.1 kinase-like domain-containing protein [Ilyonectria robusta]